MAPELNRLSPKIKKMQKNILKSFLINRICLEKNKKICYIIKNLRKFLNNSGERHKNDFKATVDMRRMGAEFYPNR